MFHFPSFPPNTLYIQVRVTGHISSRVSPFGHPRITARLPAPRGLSQAPTSFIGSWCQGIHRAPLKTYPTHAKNCTDTKMLASTVQFSSNGQPQPPPDTNPTTVERYIRRPQPTPTTHQTSQPSQCSECPESKAKEPKSPCPLPQDPTACHKPPPTSIPVPSPPRKARTY
jgi:hypothetical protein